MSKKNRRAKNATPKVKRQEVPFVERPFEGMRVEPDLVAMREILPLATMKVRTSKEYGEAEVTLATILPQMSAGIRREDGEVLVALQTIMSSGDASRDVANSILLALELEPGQALSLSELPEPGPRLQDILDPENFSELDLHEEPTFWMTPEEAEKPTNQEALHNAREQLIPTREVPGQKGAYWCRMSREFLRWVRPEPRDTVLDALARLRAKGEEAFTDAKFVGAFRAQGLSIPVWELDRGTEADELNDPLAQFLPKFEEALASTQALTPEQKRARAGIVSRQVTLR